MAEFEVHSSSANVDRAYLRLRKEKRVCERNRELLLKFSQERLARGVSRLRTVKCLYVLRYMAVWHKVSFEEATKESLTNLVNEIDCKPLSNASKHDFKAILKVFFKWLKGNDEEYPPEIKWLKPRMKQKYKLPEELLTEEEVLRLAKAADHPRDRAFVLVLYETGCRIGEILTVKMKNVQFDQYGAILRVTGKTGDRRVRIISSAPALATWVQLHAKADDPEAPLWPPLANSHRYHNRCMEYRSAYVVLHTLAERAGIKKKVHPHLFRHSRATVLASKLTESQMKEYLGWAKASDMAAVYVHLSGRDVDSALLALQGMVKPEDRKEEQMKILLCPRCQERNSPIAKFCLRCGSPMGIQAAMQIEDERKAGDELLNKLMQNPEFKAMMFKKVVELGLAKKLA
ncbi:MAG: site-specific integrase [Candidatus Anstonellaceae archaeon]